MPEEFKGIFDVPRLGDHFLEVIPAAGREGRVKEVPDEIDDQDSCGNAVDDPPDIENLLGWKEPLKGLEFIKEKGKPCDHEQEKRADKEIVLNPFSEIHPLEYLIVVNEGRAIHVFLF